MTDQVDDTRRKNWGWFYYEVVDQWGATIKADGLAVYMVLIRHADQEGTCYPSTATIAEKTGLSRRHVVSTLQTLAGHNLISITSRTSIGDHGGTVHQSNLYRLLPLPSAPAAVLHSLHIPMQEVHNPTAQDTQGVMSPVHKGYAPPAHKQDPINKTQENQTQLTNDNAPQKSNKAESFTLTPKQERAFAVLWAKYPTRSGSKGSKREAQTAFAAIAEDRWEELAAALRNYITVCSGDNARMPKDACRWLKSDYWTDYIELEIPPPPKGSPDAYPPKRSTYAEREHAAAATAVSLVQRLRSGDSAAGSTGRHGGTADPDPPNRALAIAG